MTYRTEDGIYVRTKKSKGDGYLAEAKRSPFHQGDIADGDAQGIIRDTAEGVWFEYGDTASDAIDKVLAEVRAAS